MKLVPVCVLFVAAAAFAGPPSLAERRAALSTLLDDEWSDVLRSQPEFASSVGDRRFNDRWSDASEAAALDEAKRAEGFLARLVAIDTSGFTDTERLNHTLLKSELARVIDGAAFRGWRMPLHQMSGVHIEAPMIVQMVPFETVKDYDDYIARLHALPALIDQNIAVMRLGMAAHAMPPRFLLEKVPGQIERLVSADAAKSPFAVPLAKLPKTIDAATSKRLTDAIHSAISVDVNPAYRRLQTFVRDTYAKAGRTDVGVWAIPNGAAYYAHLVRSHTTTNMTPEQVHTLGLSEVARLDALMLATAKKLGFTDVRAFYASLEKNAAVHFRSREHILELYRKYTDQMRKKLPELFGRIPKASLLVESIPAYQEQENGLAFYEHGSPDGSRPAHVMVNTFDFAKRTSLTVETTAYHEGLPGHHMQVSLAQELSSLPPFRRHGGNTAYTEGWALYAERVGEELGFYQDPYSFFGHIQDEMLRAIRLVVDTGLHYKHWTRQQVIDFFHAHSGADTLEIENETDRYIVWPGQALGYKVGQLKLLALREAAKKQLGARFDLRAFHDLVLGGGAMPLDVLEAEVNRWVASFR